MKRSAGSLFVLLGLILTSVVIAPVADAQKTIYIDTDVAAEATSVVNGSVVSVTTVELDGTPHTVHEVSVIDVLAGTAPDTIYLEIPGGQRSDGAFIVLSNSAEFLNVGATMQLAIEPTIDAVANMVVAAGLDPAPVFSVVGAERGMSPVNGSGFAVDRAASDYSFNGFARPGFVPPAQFRINPANSGVSSSATISAVRAGFDRWEDDAPSAIDFTYAGTTTNQGLHFSNGQTDVSWQFPNSENRLGTSLAVAHMAIINGVYEFEVVMSRSYQWAPVAIAGKFDIETVMAHEVGHGLGLSHVPNAQSEVMFPSIPSGTAKHLGQGDLNGARILYPNNNPAPEPTPTPTPPPPPTTGGSTGEPGHSVDANANGHVATVSLKADGVLWARRDLGNGWSSWQRLGAGQWASADVTISPSGTVQVAAVKKDGRLFTQQWTSGGTWTGWVNHGNGWNTATTPSISSNISKTLLGVIDADGRLVTKVFESSWSGPTMHGLGGWASVDVDVARDGDLWFAGVKSDGRLYLRKHLGSAWSGFGLQGAPTWSADTPPAVAARSNGVVFAAVKTDGRLYTRQQVHGRWANFVRHGVSEWSSVDIAMTDTGVTWLAANKSWGRLYTRGQSASGTWGAWASQGADTWSAKSDPSIAISAGNEPVFIAVKDSRLLYLRPRTANGWADWAPLGVGNWATN